MNFGLPMLQVHDENSSRRETEQWKVGASVVGRVRCSRAQLRDDSQERSREGARNAMPIFAYGCGRGRRFANTISTPRRERITESRTS